MATKNKKNNSKTFTLENALDTVSFVNTIALTTTEKAIDKGINLVGKYQTETEKLLIKGFEFSSKKQDIAFDVLESSKNKTLSTFNKIAKRFNKKSA